MRGFVYSADSVKTCDDWYTNGIFFCVDCLLTVSSEWYIVPIVTCLHRVRRIHKAAQTPLPRETFITCAWAVATARRPWAGLTLCLGLHGRPCVWLPFAAACCNFQYFQTPLANFLLSRPNSVEYGNCKTTTLLPLAKCTRPLF